MICKYDCPSGYTPSADGLIASNTEKGCMSHKDCSWQRNYQQYYQRCIKFDDKVPGDSFTDKYCNISWGSCC